MANILFTWEIGEASGHIAPYINLIHLLEQKGHTVFFAAKSLANTHRLLKNTRAMVLQAPTLHARPSDLYNPVDSYTKILHNTGYARSDELAGLIEGWKNLYTLCQPDLCLYDYSPTAMLAARGLPVKKLQIGTGFFSPPDISPLPGLAELQGLTQNQDEIILLEQRIIANINAALSANALPNIHTLFDIQDCDERLFLSFKELDHYPMRKAPENFIGVFRAPKGELPQWPAGNTPKIFAYLKPFKNIEFLLDAINQRQLRTLIYPDGISEKTQNRFTSATLTFVKKPLDMQTITQTADAAICNANHGTLCELLLGGTPMLLLPLHAEQNICARNVQKIGAGLSAPKLHGPSMVAKLDAILTDPQYKKAAMLFAERYNTFNQIDLNEQVFNSIQKLLQP